MREPETSNPSFSENQVPRPLESALLPSGRPSTLSWERGRDIVLTIIGSAVILYMLGLVLERFTKIILIFVLSAVVALMLEPLVSRLERLGIPRGWSTSGVYLGFVLALAGISVWGGGGLVTQLSQLNEQLPAYVQELQGREIPAVQAWLAGHGLRVDLSQLQQNAGTALQSAGAQLAGRGLGIAAGVTNALIDFILILVVSLYLVLDGNMIRDRLASLVPEKRRRIFLFLETSLVRVVGGYIRGQVVMAAIIGISSGLGCWILGVRYPLVIGVLAFFFELIPMLGPVLAAIPAIVISLFQPFPLVLLVIGFFIVMQLIENNVLGPRITGHAVGLHPIVTILAMVGGADLAGLWGALFAVPVIGLAVVFASAAYNELRGRPPGSEINPRKVWTI